MRIVATMTFLVLLLGAPARAQFETASVVGTIRDATGAIIPGGTVTLTNIETGVSMTKISNEEGNYEFITVKPGLYLVTAELTGFATALADNVTVQVGARLRVDLSMAVGQVSEKVEVRAASPLLETDSSQRGQVV